MDSSVKFRVILGVPVSQILIFYIKCSPPTWIWTFNYFWCIIYVKLKIHFRFYSASNSIRAINSISASRHVSKTQILLLLLFHNSHWKVLFWVNPYFSLFILPLLLISLQMCNLIECSIHRLPNNRKNYRRGFLKLR